MNTAPMFHNLTEHGWLPNGLFPLFATLLIVNFAFNGTEMIGIAAGETENPEKNVPKAIHAAVWRLIIFFCRHYYRHQFTVDLYRCRFKCRWTWRLKQ